jgi:DDE superfamily endonuclease
VEDHDLRIGVAPRWNGFADVDRWSDGWRVVPRLRRTMPGTDTQAGATLRYLPQYSPDLNPIEEAFSKFKAHLRKLAQRTIPGIHGAIRSFLSSLRGKECANYLRHAGYASI